MPRLHHVINEKHPTARLKDIESSPLEQESLAAWYACILSAATGYLKHKEPAEEQRRAEIIFELLRNASLVRRYIDTGKHVNAELRERVTEYLAQLRDCNFIVNARGLDL